MKTALAKVLAALNRSNDMIDAALQQTADMGRRAAFLAETLRTLWPSPALFACLLERDGQRHLCVLDAAGKSRPEWEQPLSGQLDHHHGAERQSIRSAPLRPDLDMPDLLLVSAEIAFWNRRHGVLAFAIKQNDTKESAVAAHTVLAICADLLATRLYLEEQAEIRQQSQEDLAALNSLADLSELTGPLVHEFNNFLNVVVLQVAVLEHAVPDTFRPDLAEIAKQAKSATSLIRKWHEYRRRREPALHQIDLNATVRAAIEALAQQSNSAIRLSAPRSSECGSERDSSLTVAVLKDQPEGNDKIASQRPEKEAVSVLLELAPQLPAVFGSYADLRRLCTFLVRNALGVAALCSGTVAVRTDLKQGKLILRVEDSGPSIAPEQLGQMFEAGSVCRAGSDSLELAACKSLVRRLQGRIHGETRGNGGMAIVVELPVQSG
jgi:signal transduction histidine kinase